MKNPTKLVRRLVQVLFLLAFLWFFIQTRWHEGGAPPRPLFLAMDPLAAITTMLAPTPVPWRLFTPAAAVLVVTVLAGRVFCGWVCPLGTTLDICDHVLWRRQQRRLAQWNRPALKYYLLAAVLAAAVFGTQLAWILDPIPLLTRTCATVGYPVTVGAYNLGITAGRPLWREAGFRLDPVSDPPTFALNLPVAGTFVGIIALSLLSRRYWCRSLCPLGALLALVGRFGVLRRRVEACVKCGRCATACKMGAIPEPTPDGDFRRTVSAECIQCYDCLVCPDQGISTLDVHLQTGDTDARTHASRRYFLAALIMGALYGATAGTGAGRRATHGRLIRPPGAIARTPSGLRPMTEREFRDLCVRCGNCMKACITGGLQPAVVEAGFDGVFTPILVPRLGHCEQSCTACGQVCPTGALRPFRADEKPRIRIGLATLHSDKCLSWRKGSLYKLCLVCNEHCAYGAVKLIQVEGQQRPVVDADVCTGCGQCEHACPVKPEAAIVVYRRDSRV